MSGNDWNTAFYSLNRRAVAGAWRWVSPLAIAIAMLAAAVTLGTAPLHAADCASLTGLKWKDTTITSAKIVPAAGALPEYCKVMGSIHNLPHSTIQFAVSLPTTGWNGKYFVVGGGGYNGTIPRFDQALAEGYAAAGSDTGHVAPKNPRDGSWALNNLDAQNNYSYLATHVVTLLGKQLLREYYGRHERRSYFVGCSNGGKMALEEVQRYPDDFDGAVAGDPAIDRTMAVVQYIWNDQALEAAPIPRNKIPAIEKATMKACRISGEAVNGVLITPGRCKFDPKVLLCPAGDNPSCLTAGQVRSLQKILGGPVNSVGVQLYPGFLPGHEDDYPIFMTGDGKMGPVPAASWVLQEIFMRDFVFGPNYESIKQFNFDKDLAALVPVSYAQDNAQTDLSKFRAHGGKLILYHGWADHSITPVRTIQYYAAMIDTMGNQELGEENADAVNGFARLFMVPGMHHCGRGPGANVFGGAGQGLPPQMDAQHDVVMALDNWVENGVAPEKIIASHLTDGAVDRTQVLCPYPQVAVYNGAGDVNQAENFHCEQRPYWWQVAAVPSALKTVNFRTMPPLSKPRRQGPRMLRK
ncbi:MAG TPA: tannase/feruloyl esterase family alpha/beta hydrolase [Candidatus Dormibacteraeota bacterium]|nr:tannase/feruloyl esterase family alpha/beta hydrolase [Candidatus Dormibacteraeota bacterium]